MRLLYALFCCLLFWVSPTQAQVKEGINVRNAELQLVEEQWIFNADFDINLNSVLEEALQKGVPLYFTLEIEIIRPRWYWFDEKIYAPETVYKISFNALTRQYRYGIGSLYQSAATMEEALRAIGHIYRRPIIDRNFVKKDTAAFKAQARLHLDISQLPKPFQLTALANREWNLSSDWIRLNFYDPPAAK